MWEKLWGYKEGFVVCTGLLLTGILLQVTIGKINWDLLAFPVNIILLILYLSTLLLFHTKARKVYLFRWMSSFPATVSALIAVAAMTVIMGFTRQLPAQEVLSGLEAGLGFSQMLSAWPFVLLFTWLMTILGSTILRRLYPFRRQNIPFLLNHLGLFIAVVGAVMGSADMQRLKMTVSLGKAEWRARTSDRHLLELPLALELTGFTIDEYPPKLMLIDNETGKTLPEGKPENLLLEEEITQGYLGEWQIEVMRHIPQAASVNTSDSVKFVDFHSIGSTYAVYIRARHRQGGEQKEGWVSCGSFLFPYKTLRLNEAVSLIMPEREPRRFASDIQLYTRSGHKQTATIEVNKPLTIEGWKIYQLSYDETKGKWSDISIFELVRDPWLPVVYTGIYMLIAGAVWMFITASKRKEENL